MALSQNLKGDFMLDELPAWKKELILRKRANSRVYGDLSITSVAYSDTPVVSTTKCNIPQIADSSHLEPCSIRGQQLSSCSGRGLFNSAAIASVEKVQIQSQFESTKSSEGVNNAVSVSDSLHSAVTNIDINNVDNKILSGDRKIGDMHQKGLVNRHTGRSSSKGKSDDWNQEEFQYGPGIVSRLKDRYLSLAMREAKSRASLRKYSSLEDLLDDSPVLQRGRSPMKASKTNSDPQPSRKELMKRTRSVDSLSFRKSYEPAMQKSVSSGGIKSPTNETASQAKVQRGTGNKVVNIDDANKIAISRKSSTSSSTLDEIDKLQPDTVRQTKQIFEGGTSGPRVARGTASKVAAYKASQAMNKPVKPPIKAKPPQLMSRKAPLRPAMENVRVSLKQVPSVVKPSPRSTLNIRATGFNENVSPSHKKYVPSGLTPVTASVTAPLVNGDYKLKNEISENGYRSVSCNSISNLRNESQDITDRGISSVNSKGRPLSPIPASFPPSPPSSRKITTNLIDPDTENLKEIERVMHENKKNMEKHLSAVSNKSNEINSISSKPQIGQKENEILKDITSTVPNVSSPVDTEYIIADQVVARVDHIEVSEPSILSSVPSMRPKTKLREAQNNSVMFDFTKRSQTPTYIENDGMDMSKRKGLQCSENSGYVIMPGYEGRQDSSTDGEDMEEDHFDPRTEIPPPPCNIRFEGEGVIINGSSNLQRQPKSKKLEISFDMSMTSLCEYPSEASVLVEYEDSEVINNSPTLQGGLACYTPSKLQVADSFRLGMSKSLIMHPPTPPKERPPEDFSILEHLRPANESETITWSSDNAPDLLF